jgi:cytochrome P450
MSGDAALAIPFPTVLDDETDFAVDVLPDLYGRLRELRERKPAVWVRSLGEPALMFVTHELVEAAFRDEDTFPSQAYYDGVVSGVLGRNIQCMYGDEHRVNRALVSPAFRKRLMPDLVDTLIEPVAHELVDRFEGAGSTDLVDAFTRRFPFTIILRLMGLPAASEDDMIRWALGMFDIQQHPDHAMQCSQEFVEYVHPFIEQRRTDPGDDLISALATEEAEGKRLTDEEIFSFLRLLFPAGADTTYLGLGSTLYGLLSHPDQLDALAADPGTHCHWATEEGLRWNAPVPLQPRRNPRDVVWHGIPIPAGAYLIYAVGAANRDPAVFEDPDRFDIHRRTTGALTFGLGAHYCLGVHLARVEIETALRVLTERLPRMRLADDDIRIQGTFIQFLQGPTRLPVRFD